MAERNQEPPRIVCTKCCRIVRIKHHSLDQRWDGLFIVYQCCERVIGRIWCDTLFRGADLTTNDVHRVQLDEFEQRHREQFDDAKAMLAFVEWVKGQ